MPSVQTKSSDTGGLSGDKSREMRLGLVMYGGVSLAIYINGVAHEFFRAVRGRGVYKLIKALTDSDIIVDVISGTSAGGINGILLAYALCNNKDFSSCANLWRIDGDIRSLLRSPAHEAAPTESLFDSEGYYQQRLEAAFREMPDYVPEECEIDSPFAELDLFVTGTDVDGNTYTQFDDAGHPIDVKDHRSVFHLKHRQGRKEPFKPDLSPGQYVSTETTFQALAKLARITSCFPAAFCPVHVADDRLGDATVDGKLQTWGDLGKDSYFLDGGVIDNKPFTYTIKEIFHRAADRQVDRKLFYVEPDPERFTKQEAALCPNLLQAVIASLIGIPGYESIADDLKMLARHNSKIRQYERLRNNLEQSSQPICITRRDRQLYETCSLIVISERVIQGLLRVEGKDELLSHDARLSAVALIEAFDKMHQSLRKVRSERQAGSSVPSILKNFDVYYRLRRLFRTVYKIAEVLQKKQDRFLSQTESDKYTSLWRMLNRQIELLDIQRYHMERLVDQAQIDWQEEIAAALKSADQETVSQKAALIWAVVNAAWKRLLGPDGEPAAIVTAAFGETRQRLRHPEPGVSPKGLDAATLHAFNAALKRKADEIVAEMPAIIAEERGKDDAAREQEDITFKSILQTTKELEMTIIRAMLNNSDDSAESSVRDVYFHFDEIDLHLFPIELFGELNEKDVIETIRISPLDARKGFSNRQLADKVSGDALYHFGGFFKRSWRSNDILWGRLDSLCQLVEALLDTKRMAQLLANPGKLRKVRARFFHNQPEAGHEPRWISEMTPAVLFPNAGAATHQAIEEWLKEMLWDDRGSEASSDQSARTHGFGEERFSEMIARIIEAAQLEVLNEDLPNVITDALEEQAKWNQFCQQRTYGPKGNSCASPDPEHVNPFVFKPAEGTLDPFVSVLAAAGTAKEAMRGFKESPASKQPESPMQTNLGRFFHNQYRVGSESLTRDIPPLVLLEMLSVALLVLRNCIFTIFGSKAETIRSQPLYKFMVELPLRGFHTLVVFTRRYPGLKLWLPVLLTVISALLLFIGITWRDVIIWTPPEGTTALYAGSAQDIHGEFQLRWFLFFIASPLLIIGAHIVYLYHGMAKEWRWLGRVRDAFIALLILFPVLVLIITYREVFSCAVTGLQNWDNSLGQAAGYIVGIAIALTFLGPVIGLSVLELISRKKRLKPKDLAYRLEKFFSLHEMLVIARRLDLFETEELDGLAAEIGVMSSEEIRQLTEKLQLTLAVADPRYHEEKRSIVYSEVLSGVKEIEKEIKRKAYEELNRKLAQMKNETTERALGEIEYSQSHGDREKLQAVDAMFQTLQSFEEKRKRLAMEWIDGAQQPLPAEPAGKLLASRIAAKAKSLEQASRPRDRGDSPLHRLEQMMCSINPEVLR